MQSPENFAGMQTPAFAAFGGCGEQPGGAETDYMIASMTKLDSDLQYKLKWLMLSRVLFITLLFGSTLILHLSGSFPLEKSLYSLYWLIAIVFAISFIYRLLLYHISKRVLFAYFQMVVDTAFVTLIIFMTGSYASLFSFLYLVVIIYASMLLFRRGSLVTAALCSIQYGLMIYLEYQGLFESIGLENLAILPLSGAHMLYKIITMTIACFAVAFLSSILSEQERKTKQDLWKMEEHVKRVQKMAAIGEMAAGLAHEVKNPLASLRGAIQMLMEEIACNAEHDKLMRIVLREADRLSTLVGDFLLFAKPPAGKIETVNLGKALDEITDLFEKDNECAGIRIERELLPEIWVPIDPDHLRQILWNLLLNSAEAMRGNGRIGIRMYLTRNRHVIIEISDTGAGMPEDVVKSVFDPFYTTKQNGTGLGLSIVHRILEYYDTWLDIRSEVGNGTTVTLKLKRTSPPKS